MVGRPINEYIALLRKWCDFKGLTSGGTELQLEKRIKKFMQKKKIAVTQKQKTIKKPAHKTLSGKKGLDKGGTPVKKVTKNNKTLTASKMQSGVIKMSAQTYIDTKCGGNVKKASPQKVLQPDGESWRWKVPARGTNKKGETIYRWVLSKS